MDFKVAQKIYELQQKMQRVKKEMENIIIESEVDGIVVVINGNIECKEVNRISMEKMKFLEDEIKNYIPKE